MKKILIFLGLRYIFRKYILYNVFIKYVLSAINSFRWKKIELVLIIWPPAINILYLLKQEIEKDCKILDQKIFQISNINFENFVYELYSIDNATKQKVRNKIHRLQVNKNQMVLLKIKINKPEMVVQDLI